MKSDSWSSWGNWGSSFMNVASTSVSTFSSQLGKTPDTQPLAKLQCMLFRDLIDVGNKGPIVLIFI